MANEIRRNSMDHTIQPNTTKIIYHEAVKISSVNFHLEINKLGEASIFDDEGKLISDANKCLAVQKKLLMHLTAVYRRAIEEQLRPVPRNTTSKAADAAKELRIGEIMPDGTIYTDTSSTTGTNLYVMPIDIGTISFEKSMQFMRTMKKIYCHTGSRVFNQKDLENSRKDDGGWRLPTFGELKQIYENRKETGLKESHTSTYLSMPLYPNSKIHILNFLDGKETVCEPSLYCSARFVRTEPRIRE